MTELERAAKEYEKCKNDPYYFFKTYCTVKTTISKTKMVTREILNDKEYEEVKHIFLKYFTEDEKQRKCYSEHIYMIEKLMFSDGGIVFSISLYGNRYNVTVSAIDYDDNYIMLLRKERLEKICHSRKL